MNLLPQDRILDIIRQSDKEIHKEELLAIVEHLMDKDFNALIQVLYRLDVSEESIRTYTADKYLTGEVLTNMILQRIYLREEAKKLFTQRYTKDDPDAEFVEPW
jgi:hypothetical protein